MTESPGPAPYFPVRKPTGSAQRVAQVLGGATQEAMVTSDFEVVRRALEAARSASALGGRRADRRRTDEQLRSHITQERWMVAGHRITERLTVSYTVGLTAAGLPEIACYGLKPANARRLLDAAARYMIECRELMPGERITTPAGHYPLAIIDMDDTADLAMVRQVYGMVMGARQVVWPDPNGNFPWQMAWTLGPVQPMAGEPCL